MSGSREYPLQVYPISSFIKYTLPHCPIRYILSPPLRYTLSPQVYPTPLDQEVTWDQIYPSTVNRQTSVETLPSRNFVCGQ